MARWLVVVPFVFACTNPTVSEQAAPAPVAPATPVPVAPATPVPATPVPATPGPAVGAGEANAEPAPVEAEAEDEDAGEYEDADDLDDPEEVASPLRFVMLGRDGSRTKKPVANAVLGHAWGWDTATKATIDACNRVNDGNVGKMMWCSTEEKPAGSAELVERRKIRPGRSVFVKPEDVAAWRVAPPPGPVWLVGPDRVCKASVGRPLVGTYVIDPESEPEFEDHFTILELAWELTGCPAATPDWAPIGVAADTLDEATRWVRAKSGPRARFDPATWKGALAEAIAGLPGAAKRHSESEGLTGAGPEWWSRSIALPGTDVRELFVAAVWRDPESTREPGKFGCGDHEMRTLLRHRGQAGQETALGRGLRGELVGGLVIGAGAVDALVWVRGDDYVAAKLAADGLGRSVRLTTGASHPESGDVVGYSLIGYCGP